LLAKPRKIKDKYQPKSAIYEALCEKSERYPDFRITGRQNEVGRLSDGGLFGSSRRRRSHRVVSALAGGAVKEGRECHGREEVIKRNWPAALRHLAKASSYEEVGAFWDARDLTDHWDQTKPVEFEVRIKSQATRPQPKEGCRPASGNSLFNAGWRLKRCSTCGWKRTSRKSGFK